MSEPPYLIATRAAYDTVAADYADLLRGELDAKPLDRALLATFAELVEAAGGGLVADLGCGPGRITAHLHQLGLDVVGIDLSPGMIALARRDHSHLPFSVGTMTALDLADRALGGVVAWYSLIHTPLPQLPTIVGELARVLSPGGYLVIAFQVGDECMHLIHAYGHELSLDTHRLPCDHVAALLEDAGLVVTTRVLREPEGLETLPQAYLLARKPSG